MSTDETAKLKPTPGTPAAEEEKEGPHGFWEWGLAISVTLLGLFCVVCLVLATLSVIHGYQRGQTKRDAENQTKIARQHLEQRAFEQYARPQR